MRSCVWDSRTGRDTCHRTAHWCGVTWSSRRQTCVSVSRACSRGRGGAAGGDHTKLYYPLHQNALPTQNTPDRAQTGQRTDNEINCRKRYEIKR
eukprot:scaffold57326_cov69-Phaeocystis_antarctica.AAC.1